MGKRNEDECSGDEGDDDYLIAVIFKCPYDKNCIFLFCSVAFCILSYFLFFIVLYFILLNELAKKIS